MKSLRIILAVIGTLLVLDSILVSTLSNFNLGVILPAFLGAPLLFLAVFLPRMDHGVLYVLKIAAIVGYSIALVVFLVCGILMRTAAKRAEEVDADTLIVLGAALHGDRVTWVLSNRLDTAADYFKKHPDCVIIVSGGQGSGEDIPEAVGMQRYLTQVHGIPESKILIEDQATSTLENFIFSKGLIEQRFKEPVKIAFVTTGFHVFRAGRVAKAAGLDAPGIASPDVWYIMINNFLRECVGICVYALRGQL